VLKEITSGVYCTVLNTITLLHRWIVAIIYGRATAARKFLAASVTRKASYGSKVGGVSGPSLDGKDSSDKVGEVVGESKSISEKQNLDVMSGTLVMI
jgi:hypothetical protein